MKTNWFKRTLCSILAFVMVLGYVPVPTFAAETDGLCAHHTQHTEACGYSPAVEGHDCGHAHTDECYQSVTECVHTHGECGYVPAVDGQNCECQPDENGEIVHTEGCGYVEAVEEVPCDHICSEESGCITKVLNCQHQHDDTCAYVEASEETPCAYVCEECEKEAAEKAAEEKAAADQKAADAVTALIAALPTVEDLQAMNAEQQTGVYNQVQEAYDAYNALTEEQKALLTDAESAFASLFDYFNTLTTSSDGIVSSGMCGQELNWVYNSSSKILSISGTGKMYDYTFSDSPWQDVEIETISFSGSVNSIGNYAFNRCRGIENITIPNTVTDIGEYAFNACIDLKKIELPAGLCGVDGNAFIECLSLKEIRVDINNVNFYSDAQGVLYNKDQTKLIKVPAAISGDFVIPESVDSIGDYAFFGCSGLSSVTIPDGVTSIGDTAFYYCIGLKEIHIPESVTEIGDYAFSLCENLVTVNIPNGITEINRSMFNGCESIKEISLPNGVTRIGEGAFNSCKDLEKINIPDSVNSIDRGAFSFCENLPEITIGWNVQEIGSGTFQQCSRLSQITFLGNVPDIAEDAFARITAYVYYPIDNNQWVNDVMLNYGGSITWIPYSGSHTHHFSETHVCACGAIGGTCGEGITWEFDCETATLTFSGEGDIPCYEDITEIEWWNLNSTILNPETDIRHVVLEPGVVGIGDYALMNLTALESVELPEGFAYLGSYCFGLKGNQLTHLTLPDTLEVIDYGALSNLNITEITIPKSVQNIHKYGLPKVAKKIIFLGDAPISEYYIDQGNGWEKRIEPFLRGITSTVHYPEDNDTWTPEIRKALGGTITWVAVGENGYSAEGSCGNNLTWTLQSGALEISGYGKMDDYTPTVKAPWSEFAGDIREVCLSENCWSIGNYAFANLTSLDSIVIPGSLNSIGKMAFSNCTGLNKITINGSVPYNINETAFTGVQAFVHYTIGDNNSYVENRLKDYGGKLIWVEHGEQARMLTLSCDLWLAEPGQVGTLKVTAHPYNATADCEYSLSQEGIIQIQSQTFRSMTFKTLRPGEVTVTVRDKNSGQTAEHTIRVYSTQDKVINCPFQENIFIDELSIRRVYQFTPKETGYYAVYSSYNGEGNGFLVRYGDEYLDCVSSQNGVDINCTVYFMTKEKTYSIEYRCFDNWMLGETVSFQFREAEREIDSLSFAQDEYCFELYRNSDGSYGGWAFIQAELSPIGSYAPIQWMLSNSYVAEISWKSGNNCELRLMNPGTVVLTAYANGKFASTQIVVKSSPENGPFELELDDPLEITLDGSDHSRRIQFTAPADGWYAFRKQGAGYIGSSFPYENKSSENEFVGINYLGEGNSVTLYLYPAEEGETGTAVVSVTKANPSPQKMEVICVNNSQGNVEFRANFSPLNTFSEIVSWEISNPNILGRSKNDSSPYGNRIDLTSYGYGEVTVTATSENGLTASCTVMVGRCFEGHTYESKIIQPTCTTGGFTVHTCSCCGEEMIDSRVAALDHDLSEWKRTTEPSPDAAGTETRTCSRCEYYETRDIPYTGNILDLQNSGLETASVVWINGIAYPVQKDNTGAPYVEIPDNAPPVLVTYSYNNSSDDRHTQYPTGMQAYRIHQTPTGSTVERLPELDNLLQYSGSSIRITGNKGIRMITSVNQDTRNALTGNGLAGFKLLEYGTLLAQTSKLGNNPLVLGGANVKSNYAYKKGVADPVFKYTNGLIQQQNSNNVKPMNSFRAASAQKPSPLSDFGMITEATSRTTLRTSCSVSVPSFFSL